jgi:general secretion pathway protein D
MPAVAALSADPPKSPPAKVATAGDARFVSIDFNNVDINVFVKFISELTGRNFVIDQRVKGKVTIISPAKISIDEAYRVFHSVLEVNGFTTVPSGEVTKIVPSPDARTKNIDTRLSKGRLADEDRIVTQLIPLKYASPDDVKRLLTPLVSKSSVILSYTPSNMLVITDVSSNLRRLTKLIDAIDVAGTGQKVTVLPVEYADASKLVKILGSVFKPTSARTKGAATNGISFMADERTNSIIMLSGEAETERVKRLVALLDKETPRGKGNIHVYYLEHATAEDIAGVLQAIPQKGSAQAKTGKKTQPVISQDVRITADKATNSLIITAAKEDYEVIQDIIRKIDIPRAMVYIEALIMEVNVNKDFSLGTEYQVGEDSSYEGRDFIAGGGFTTGSGLATQDSTTGLVSLAEGFSMGVFGEALKISGVLFPSISAVVNAYKKDSDVEILSTPQILTTDNEEASITVGKNVPFQTKSTTSDNDTYSSFEYRDVGKTLTITPHISKDRMVRMGISLEVTDLQDVTDNRPTTLKRTVETTVIVQDKGTVVLGGLIDDSIDNTDLKVPCLGDIPLLGWAFRTKSTNHEKTNLYIFLTPKVVKNPMEAMAVYKDKRTQIESVREGTVELYREEDRPSIEVPAPTETESETGRGEEPRSAAPQAGDERLAAGGVDPSGKPYLLEVTSFDKQPQAKTLTDRLQTKGFPAFIQQTGAEDTDTYRYHVRLGSFETLEEAQLYQELLENEGISGDIITRPAAQ